MTTHFATGLTSREHKGHGRPCPSNATVRVCLRGPGWGRFEYEAHKLRWSHRDDAGDIIRYAVTSVPKEDA